MICPFNFTTCCGNPRGCTHPSKGRIHTLLPRSAIPENPACPADGRDALMADVNTVIQFGTCHEMSSQDQFHEYVEARDRLLNALATPAAAPAAQRMVAACCGRSECGGECGNEWEGMRPAAPAAQGGNAEYVLALLIAGGYVTQAKADEARAIALGFADGPLQAAASTQAGAREGAFPAFLTHSQAKPDAWPQGYVDGWNDALRLAREEGFGPRLTDDEADAIGGSATQDVVPVDTEEFLRELSATMRQAVAVRGEIYGDAVLMWADKIDAITTERSATADGGEG